MIQNFKIRAKYLIVIITDNHSFSIKNANIFTGKIISLWNIDVRSAQSKCVMNLKGFTRFKGLKAFPKLSLKEVYWSQSQYTKRLYYSNKDIYFR